jgi:sigma-B regulation protein RsbU (phosphoserine phosphatase)
MIHQVQFSPTILVKAVAAINILGNLFAVLILFVSFGLLEPLLSDGSAVKGLGERLAVVLAVMLFVIFMIAPINARMIIGLVREVRWKLVPLKDQALTEDSLEAMRRLAGRLLKLPVKLAGTTLSGWVIGGIVFAALPHAAPGIYPWSHQSAHKISAWMVCVAAPITVCWVYFAQERWLRVKMRALIPADALQTVPPSYRINVLPKLLTVSLIITTVPLVLVSHVTLHQICEVRAGRQTIENFLSYMPPIIWFLLGVFVVVAVALSVFVAKSLSEPLKTLESAMDKVSEGDLEVAVPVVSNDEIGHAAEGFNQMVKDKRELDSVRDTFGRYLSKEVVDEILKSPGGVELKGELREMSVLVADLRGFTGIAEAESPQKVLETINRFLETMTEIIMRHRGVIDEFTGDGILVFFGAPKAMADHCNSAVSCALAMQKAMDDVNRANRRAGLPQLQMGIGVNCGDLIVGNIGSEKRKKYGALGSPINLAFRIEGQTRGGEILVSPAVAARLDGKLVVEATKEAALKGIDYPVVLHRVVGLAGGG